MAGAGPSSSMCPLLHPWLQHLSGDTVPLSGTQRGPQAGAADILPAGVGTCMRDQWAPTSLPSSRGLGLAHCRTGRGFSQKVGPWAGPPSREPSWDRLALQKWRLAQVSSGPILKSWTWGLQTAWRCLQRPEPGWTPAPVSAAVSPWRGHISLSAFLICPTGVQQLYITAPTSLNPPSMERWGGWADVGSFCDSQGLVMECLIALPSRDTGSWGPDRAARRPSSPWGCMEAP